MNDDLVREVALARELLDDGLVSDPVVAEWLVAQREALEAALAAGDREQLVALLARVALVFVAPRGSA